ncbi:MAG: sterol desaturase family protein [Microscillaceae bacterium]|nr:sterol desaturase family protein [Microscillaceae bacterium]
MNPKEILTVEQMSNMLNESGLSEVILWAVPIMLGLVLLEWIVSMIYNHQVYEGKDLLASIGIGIGNLIVSAFIKTVLFSCALLVYNFVPWSIPITWWSFLLCIVWLDFCSYFSHRISHENRFWWSTHVVHHSSEQYNFSVSFRLSWFQHLKMIFFLPVLLVGFHPVVMFIVNQFAVLYQFWIHTEFIKKLPRPIEYIFVTPSHHRVHHASDEKYLDKNYGATFIIWDRMFGTFHPEEEKPTYGITTPVNSYNPVYLVFHELLDIIKDIRQAKSFREAWRVTFMSPTKLGLARKAEAEKAQKKAEEKELVA